MGHLRLEIENKSSFTPKGSLSRVFDRPDLMSQVYNQFLREVLSEICKSIERYFGHTCLAYSTKLEFQERNTPLHHGLFCLDYGVIKFVEEIYTIISAELPRVA